mmetsp:Transcript_35979/g.74799  ORF Transcript_35979/g.74799 Transcript_35979/m.74799 type:complete len:103 (-) Transcript_35979:27-335(-)
MGFDLKTLFILKIGTLLMLKISAAGNIMLWVIHLGLVCKFLRLVWWHMIMIFEFCFFDVKLRINHFSSLGESGRHMHRTQILHVSKELYREKVEHYAEQGKH